MPNIKPSPKTSFSFERILAIAGAIICLITCLRVWQVIHLNYSPGGQPADMWPLPALYLLEMVIVSWLGVFSLFSERPIVGVVIWATAGIVLAFALLGAWSIGLFFLPTALILAIVALISTKKQNRSIVAHFGFGLLAGLAQIVLMWLAVLERVS